MSKIIKNKNKILCLLRLGLSLAVILSMLSSTAFAEDIWTKAEEILRDVYSRLLTLSTFAAVVTSAIALLMMNLSKSGKTVDESRAWLKRIAITWAILNSLGFILAWVTPYFNGGKGNG